MLLSQLELSGQTEDVSGESPEISDLENDKGRHRMINSTKQIDHYRTDPAKKYLVSFSGGRSSGMMLKLLLDSGDPPDLVVFCNTGKEREETLQFVVDCEKRWGFPIVWLEYDYKAESAGGIKDPRHVHKVVSFEEAARNGEPFEALISSRKMLPNLATRFCTSELKVLTISRYCRRDLGWENKGWIELLGIRYDEPRRWQKAFDDLCRVDYPLVHARVTKEDVQSFWAEQEFDLGIPGEWSNCNLCFMKGAKNIADLIRERPETVEWWKMQEERIGNRFLKDSTYAEIERIVNNPTAGLPLFNDTPIDCYCGE